MTFGFADEGEEEEDTKPKELEHKVLDTLRWQKWDDLEIGKGVQSVLTGVKGFISGKDNHYKLIEIDWENGKKSRAAHTELSKVIFALIV